MENMCVRLPVSLVSFDRGMNLIYGLRGNLVAKFEGEAGKWGQPIFKQRLALDGRIMGRLAMVFPFTGPHDVFDWDANECLVYIFDSNIAGKGSRYLSQAPQKWILLSCYIARGGVPGCAAFAEQDRGPKD